MKNLKLGIIITLKTARKNPNTARANRSTTVEAAPPSGPASSVDPIGAAAGP